MVITSFRFVEAGLLATGCWLLVEGSA